MEIPYTPEFEKVISYTYRSAELGPHLLILGGIHGNEICGQRALSALKEELESGSLHLLKGVLTLVPYANPWACASFKRYMERNLNRVIGHYATPDCYEERLGVQIASLIDQCDVMVDIHSISSQCPAPFVLNEFPHPRNEDLSHALGGEFVVKEWHEMFKEVGGHLFKSTQMYAEEAGKCACLIECGQHDDDSAIDVAARAARNAMKFAGLIPGELVLPKLRGEIVAKKAFVKQRPGKMTRADWHHLMPVRKGETIAVYEDGDSLNMPDDGYILLPYHGAQVGDEWFYFGKMIHQT